MADPTPASSSFLLLDATAVQSSLTHSSLISHLLSSLPLLSLSIESPLRHSHPLDNSSNLLLMPAWSHHPLLPYIGVKIVVASPNGVAASYLLFSSPYSPTPLAAIDGTLLTLIRTSAVSALAARFLARSQPQTLLVAGAGALAPHLVAAHLLSRPSLSRVILWNRTPDKARLLALRLGSQTPGVTFEHAEILDEVVPLADIVSCATGSEDPIVKGERLKPGAHLDLVGSFTPAMRECDDAALKRGRVFVDCEAALEEAGELVGAFQRGLMSPGDVAGTLVELVSGEKVGRRSEEEVTVFKSVGTAVVDILAAQLAYETFLRGP